MVSPQELRILLDLILGNGIESKLCRELEQRMVREEKMKNKPVYGVEQIVFEFSPTTEEMETELNKIDGVIVLVIYLENELRVIYEERHR